MQVVYAGEQFPESFTKSLFLAGPTPRVSAVPSWRPEALAFLEARDFDGVVFVPEPRDATRFPDYTMQVDWEAAAMNMSDKVVFWIPRSLTTLPGLTTNDEFGWWRARDPRRVVLGTPLQGAAVHIRYQHVKAQGEGIPDFWTLGETLAAAMEDLGAGHLRSHGERCIPLHLWHCSSFQYWYANLLCAGNRLDEARVEWIYRVGPAKRIPFFWALWVKIWIAKEGRFKENEVVISRPNISTTVAWCGPVHGTAETDRLRFTRVALIREFRAPVSNEEGMVTEAPGGSTFKATVPPLVLAASEFTEETGLAINPERFRLVQTRQILATMSGHHGAVASVALTASEMDRLAEQESAGTAHGVAADTERTTIAVRTVEQLLQSPEVDWTMMGMILTALCR